MLWFGRWVRHTSLVQGPVKPGPAGTAACLNHAVGILPEPAASWVGLERRCMFVTFAPLVFPVCAVAPPLAALRMRVCLCVSACAYSTHPLFCMSSHSPIRLQKPMNLLLRYSKLMINSLFHYSFTPYFISGRKKNNNVNLWFLHQITCISLEIVPGGVKIFTGFSGRWENAG